MKSQSKACSFGQFEITTEYDDDNIDSKLSAPGVMDVRIAIPLGSADEQMLNAVGIAAQVKLGFNLPGPFQHVIYVVHSCGGCSWAGYAAVNSWSQVYQGKYMKYTGVQVHELGHNLNLAHSGKNGEEYGDHTCMVSSKCIHFWCF